MLLERPWIHAAGAVPSSLHQKVKYVKNCCLIEINAEQEYIIKQANNPQGIQAADEEEGEEMLRGFEIVAVTPVVEGSRINNPVIPKQVIGAARATIAAVGKQNLKRRIDESQPIILPKKQEGTFGLGFKPRPADRERAKQERRERKRANLAGELFKEPPMNIPPTLRAFRSAGFINMPDLGDLHISAIEDEDCPIAIRRVTTGEDLGNYTVTPLTFPIK
jgi:hypothetical protein